LQHCGENFFIINKNIKKEETTVKSGLFFLLFIACLFLLIPSSSTSDSLPNKEDLPPPYLTGEKVCFSLQKKTDYKEQGVASWYGKEFHGKKTSNGTTYDMYARSAAHRNLPFGTQVQVTNLENGKKTTVIINDRGPFAKKRIIDLSKTSANEIDLLEPGTAFVNLKIIKYPS